MVIGSISADDGVPRGEKGGGAENAAERGEIN
jgi:hypothetical protein